MPRTFTCQHCGKVTTRNPRLKKKQKYCSLEGCQNARKRAFDKKIDPTSKGRMLRKQRNKRWREKSPAHVYQRNYRNLHSEYVSSNRQGQKKRNKKQQKESCSMIVKTDALFLQPLYDGLYAGFKVKKGKIVKTDAFMLQMHMQQGLEAHFPQKPG
jgi:hypothetical protein